MQKNNFQCFSDTEKFIWMNFRLVKKYFPMFFWSWKIHLNEFLIRKIYLNEFQTSRKIIFNAFLILKNNFQCFFRSEKWKNHYLKHCTAWWSSRTRRTSGLTWKYQFKFKLNHYVSPLSHCLQKSRASFLWTHVLSISTVILRRMGE